MLAVLVLPVVFSILGTWEVLRGASARAELAGLVAQHRSQAAVLRDLGRPDAQARVMVPARPRSLLIGKATTHADEAGAAAEVDGVVSRLRDGAAWLTLLAGLAAGGAGLAGLLLVRASARSGMQSRPALVAAFGRVSRALPVLLGVQVVGIGLALSGAVAFEVGGLWFVPDPDDRTVLLALLVVLCAGVMLWGGLGVLGNLRRALRVFVPAPLALSGVPVTEAQAPGLFALLHDLARERGTTLPETVVAGAENGFFVTAFPRVLQGEADAGPVVTRGRVLHLPLPEMAVLDLPELRTVLAHELAHFSGEDTKYSLRFAPLFAGLGEGAAAMSLRDRALWGSTLVDRLVEHLVHPHTALAVHAYDQFSHVEAHWSRLRELDADRAAVASGSPASLASSLLRLGLASDLSAAERAGIAERPDQASPDLAAALVRRMAQPGDPMAHLGDQVPHPTDTHPPTWQRIQAAGVEVDETLLAHAARPVTPADFATMQALFIDWGALSGKVTGHLRDRAWQRQDADRTRLQRTAGEPGVRRETVLHASLLRPVLGLAALGSFCVSVSVGCVLAALYGGAQDREAWRLLFGIAAFATIGTGFVALWSIWLWRGRRQPFLVLDKDGVRSPGFAGAVRWLDMETIGVSAFQSPTMWFVLRPEAPLPRRTGLIRRLRLDEKRHAVQFIATLPRGLDAAAAKALLLRYARAAHARHALDATVVPPHCQLGAPTEV